MNVEAYGHILWHIAYFLAKEFTRTALRDTRFYNQFLGR
jgi:hypothetical protein